MLPGRLRDLIRVSTGGPLPTRDRLERGSVVRVSTCPNCMSVETDRHATIVCVVARVFWCAVPAGFRGRGVRFFVSHGRFPRGRFAGLLLVAGLLSLWRNRCEAVAGNCHRGAMRSLLRRLRRDILTFLSDEFLVEHEFIYRWPCPFVWL